VGGEPPYAESLGDINDLSISQAQITLINTLIATGTPVVVVLIQGRPLLLGNAVNSAAILNAYLPGLEGGQAIADTLFGNINPSGKLPYTYPQFGGDIGVPYYHKYTDKTTPLFPFGFGLSYTNFSYGKIDLYPTTIRMYENLLITVNITNTGIVAGKEVVQMYISDVYATVTPEVKLLKAFYKFELPAGQYGTVEWVISTGDLGFIGEDNKPIVEPGEFIVHIGNQMATFKVVP